MDNDTNPSVKLRIDSSLSAHGIRCEHLLQADPDQNNLILTYKEPVSGVERKLNLAFTSNEDAFAGYVLVKTDERYGLAKPRKLPDVKIEEVKFDPSFDVSL